MSQLDLRILAQHREEILKAELAAWLHDVEKAGIKESNVPKGFRQWLKASDPSSVHPWDQPLDLWLLAQCHGIAHFDKQEPDQKFESTHIDSPFGYPFRVIGIASNRIKEWLSDLSNRNIAKEVLSSHRADSRYPINEIDLWSWGETTGALVKGAWLQAILSNLKLDRESLDRVLLESLEQKCEILIQRQYSPRDPLKQLQAKLPGGSFKNLQLSSNVLYDLLPELNQWLDEASNVELQNRLTQRHWSEFLEKVSNLRERLQEMSSLLQWRLLSIRTNGLEYLLSAPSIPDLKARQELLTDAWNKVQNLLEEEYPLALEVYRDENGPVFVVPDIDNLLGLTDSESNAQALREFILERFRQGTVKSDPCLALQGEIVPVFKLDSKPWKGQPAPQELPPIGKHVGDKNTPPLKNDPQWVAAQWCNLPRLQERCTVCGLRPQGPGKKALDRNVCDICEERRAERSKKWATSQLDRTIWTDEVADTNGRLALIVGKFDLTHWLDGTLVCTLTVRIPKDQNGHTADKVAKNPSFARIRRIWETTRNFWQEVLPTDQDKDLSQSLVGEVLGLAGPRLEIKGSLQPRQAGDTLGPYHAYELVLPSGVKLSVVWDQGKKRFITADNLDYLSSDRQLGRLVKDVLQSGVRLTIEETAGYGAKNKVWGTLTIQNVHELPEQYLPTIPILAEPRTFMALVPAEKSLEVIKRIKEKYEREMGKVRNRLPLHLGSVYAHRRTPIRALLDAGRAMLGYQTEPQPWTVKEIQTGADNVALKLEYNGHQIQWSIPSKMGDGTTEDRWYPYFFVETDGDDSKADAGNRRALKVPWPIDKGKKRDGWIVHAADLRIGEITYLWPSTFDFEFLDTTARRFEIHYDEDGRRLTRTQRHQVIRTIEATREAWYGHDPDGRSTSDEVFKQFVADTLAGARWPKDQPWSDILADWRKKLIQAGVRGELADLAELHMEVLKE